MCKTVDSETTVSVNKVNMTIIKYIHFLMSSNSPALSLRWTKKPIRVNNILKMKKINHRAKMLFMIIISPAKTTNKTNIT